MKKLFVLAVFTVLINSMLFAQTIQLVMSPKPSPYFSDWQNKTETARLIVNNTSRASIDCKIKTQLFNGQGEMVGETDFSKMPVLTLEPGISQFNAEDIYPVDAIKLYGNSLTSMLKTGKIPEDNYRLCTDLVDPAKGTPLTPAPQCKMFSIVDYQAPVLLSPREDQVIPQSEIRAVMFRWSPVTPSANQLVIYRLQIWEILEGQTRADACRNNMPVYEKDLRGVLQTGWPIDFAPAEGQAGYVWSITPYDDQDRKLITEGYGMAEPFAFSLKNGINKDLKADDPESERIVVRLRQPLVNQLRLTDLSGFTLTNLSQKPIEVDISCSLAAGNPKPILIIIIILKKFTLPPGTTTITYDDVKSGNVKFSSDEWAKAFGPGGVLPPGDYEICVSALDKSGKEIGKGCINQRIIGVNANPDFSIDFLEASKIWKGDSCAIGINITNMYRGAERELKTKTFRIQVKNAKVIGIEGNTPRGWVRTPSKFPPGSTEIKWTNNSGDIPQGIVILGTIVFLKTSPEPISVWYEWLNKDDKVIASGTKNLGQRPEENKKKVAFRWSTDYQVDRADILDYLQTQELYMRKGEYRFDYSANPFGDVRIPLAKPIPDKGIDKAGMMFAVDCSDETCKQEGEACYGNLGGDKNCLITPVIENGFITHTILSFKGGNVGKELSSGDPGEVTLSGCVPVFTSTIQCAGNDMYNFSITCQNAADPLTDPTCVLDLTAVTAVGASFPVSLTTTLPLSIAAGQTATISGQMGPMLPASILMFVFIFSVPNSSPMTYAHTFTLPLPPSTPGAITGATSVCQGQTGAVYSISAVSNATSYVWTVPAGTTITSGMGTTSITVTFGNAAGNVCVSASSSCGTSTAICKAITVNSLPAQPGLLSGSVTPCVGSSQNYSVPNVAGVSYTWSFPPGWAPGGGTTNSVTKTAGTGAGTITVTPSNGCGNGPSRTLAVTPSSILTPTAPTAGTGTGIQLTQFTATWTPVAGATGYYLDVATNPVFNNLVTGYANLNVGTLTTYIVTGLSCNTPHFYRVRAVSLCGGTSANSNFIRVNTLASPGPTANPATGIQAGQFTANWTATAGVSYILDVSPNSTFGSTIAGYYHLNVGAVASYNVTGLSCNTKYYYRVRSVAPCGGPSASSNAILVTTTVATPQPPVATAATGLQGTQFTANWTSVPGADSYIIEVAPTYTFANYENPMINPPAYGGAYYLGMYQTIPVGAATSYTVTGLDWHSNNYYRVRAVSCSQTSVNSNIVMVAIPFPEVHGSWTRENPGTYSFTIGVLGSTADITGVVGQSIPVTVEIWGAGGGGGSGSNGSMFGGNGGMFGRNGGGGGGGGGYAKKQISIWIPPQNGGSYTNSYYVKIGAGGAGGLLGGVGNSGSTGGDSEVRPISSAYSLVLKATGGLGGIAGSKAFPASRKGGAGGVGTINSLPGQTGADGTLSNNLAGGAGGIGGAGGGHGNTNGGGNGGKGGNQLTSGTAGGNGRIVITW